MHLIVATWLSLLATILAFFIKNVKAGEESGRSETAMNPKRERLPQPQG